MIEYCDLEKNYLKEELYELVKNDPLIFDFIQDAFLDGIWYWDLENPENEWMSDKFWSTFGYDPTTKKHLASEWQDMIIPEDLLLAQKNFNKHLQDSSYPYDQIVRYKHKDGSTVWIRCRGIALYDHDGNPTRLLGAHTNVTSIMKRQQELLKEQLHKNEISKNLDICELKYKDLENKYEFLENKLLKVQFYDEITKLLNIESLYKVTKTLVLSAQRLNLDINLISFKIENHDYIVEHYSDVEVASKLATLENIFKNTINDIEIAYVKAGYVFGVCIGYQPNEITNFIEEIEQKTKEYHWSIVEPVLEIKTLRKNNIVEYSLETLKGWMSEL
ncbi:PAS domain-containing protein [Aliarcobacter butzleri]|uniref:PAS domain-containing protein n=1 Tax=Aliarcobacter butzleri TaxID=28197 RepID=UPI00263D3680|nr:PAS domain-containing protein [Aliarcobacter butzleri]MDN5128355.1 PAS domain-containing protein [Aliarcobacter butzleri]